MRRALLAIAVFVAALAGAPAARAHPDDVVAESNWLLGLQVATGVDKGLIAANAGDDYCVPYFANSAAQGLAAATLATGDTRYVTAAWDWLDWYAAHMDATGFVTNYRWTGRAWVSTGTMDSTDGYAGTFLVAVRDAYLASHNATRLDALWPAVGKAVTAMLATDNGAWLTYAKPGYLQLFTMDNVEVYEGFRAIEYLAGQVHPDGILQDLAAVWTANMPAAFERFWNAGASGYDIAISNTGVHYALDWTTLYPAISAQAWMLRTGLVPATRAAGLAAKIDSSFPSWDSSGSQSGGTWWPEVVEAMRFGGNSARAESGLTTMVNGVLATKRAWPYHAGNAGLLIKEMIGSPETLYTAAPPAYSSSMQASLSFQGVPAITGGGAVSFECSIDGVPFVSCSSPYGYTAPGEGTHTLAVRTRDSSGAADPTPAVVTWTVDRTPPVPRITGAPAMPANATASFTFDATDDAPASLVTFECSADGATFAKCSSPYTTIVDGTKTHTLALRATDRAGNRSDPLTYSWFADATRPDTAITAGPSGVLTSGDVSLSFTGSDDDASTPVTYQCRLNANPFAACTSPVSYSLAEGVWTFQVRSVDAVGNVDITPATRSWSVDRTPPDTVIVDHPTAIARSDQAKFSFYGVDNVGGATTYQCSLDGAPFTPCGSPSTYSSLSQAQHSFQVRAIDGAGYVDPTPARFDWSIDVTPPTAAFTTKDDDVLFDAQPLFTRQVTGTVADAVSGVATVRAQFVSSGTDRSIVFVDAVVSCSDATRRSCTWAASPPAGAGPFRVYIRATDVATNAGASVPDSIAVIVL